MKRPPEAFRSRFLFERGIGHLIVARFKGDDRVECGVFLLDVFCLGVKDAFFRRYTTYGDFRDDLLEGALSEEALETMTAASGRHLAESAMAYAYRLGLPPHPDYRKAARVFGGISAADADARFTFGRNGKPCYMQGPYDSEAKAARILRKLEETCGKDGFSYITLVDDDWYEEWDPCDDEDDALEESVRPRFAVSEPAERSAMGMTTQFDSLISRLHTENRDIFVIQTPPDRPKFSDMLVAVADPHLDKAEDSEDMDEIIAMATLAWNFSLLAPESQREALADLEPFLANSEHRAAFLDLAERARTLFPTERRPIFAIETGINAPEGTYGIRVAAQLGPVS